MKKINNLIRFGLVAFLAISINGYGQKTGDPRNVNYEPVPQNNANREDPSVFLQGTYVEVGVHPAGSCGTPVAPPAGYHWWNWYSGLGFVADYGRDGWAVGNPPYSGDYFVPGDPVEGWILEWDYNGGTSNFVNEGLENGGSYGVPQTSLTNTSTATEQSCIWVGTASNGPNEQVEVTQVIHFKNDDLFFVFDITLKNVGTVTLENVEYMRNVDPDQEEDWTGNYATSNYVQNQPGVGNSGDTALIVAKGLLYGIPLGLGTINSHAVVSHEGFYNTDPDAILDSPVANPPNAPEVNDIAINLAYRFPSLAPGESITFSYAYVLNEDDLANLGEILTPSEIPVSNWALAIGMILIIAFTVIRFRKM